MSELGRRAVACKGFRWLPGMLGAKANGGTDRIMDESEAKLANDDLLPDLEDPCTLGGMGAGDSEGGALVTALEDAP